MTPRERAMLKLLRQALAHIGSELYHAGPDEVAQHPMLQMKLRFTERAEKQIKKWEAA